MTTATIVKAILAEISPGPGAAPGAAPDAVAAGLSTAIGETHGH